nr:DC-STAMP domain-containing protein 2-like [Biomphalaria glabrata]
MAFVQAIQKALRVKKILKNLERAKINTIRELVGLPPERTWFQMCCQDISSAVREICCRTFCPCCVDIPSFGECLCPRGSFCFKCCSDGFYPNTVMKNILGFAFGLVLTMGLFFFFCLQLKTNMEFALGICIILAFILSIGLAFSITVRCIVFLALPNFCSSKGRSILLMYAMVLVLNYPVQNYSHNMVVLSNSTTCGQSLALNATKKLLENAASPLFSVLNGIEKMLKAIKRFAEKVRDAFKALLRAVREIFSMVARVFQWLAGMTDVCNENMGQPYRKCKKAFDDGYNKCCAVMSIFKFLCGIVTLVGYLCNIARIGELLCLIADAIKDFIVSKIGAPVMARINDIKDMFYFNVSIDYHFHYSMNQSRPYSDVVKAIMKEIKEKLTIIDVLQTIVDNIMAFTILLVVVKAVMYRRGYLYKNHFDNYYITKHLYDIDARRKEMDKDSLFPLKYLEQIKFIPTFSHLMTKKELKKMLKGLLFWSFSAFSATYYIVCDYGLYWILDLVRRHLDVRTSAAIPPHLQLHVKGQGPMADVYKSMVGVIEPVSDSGLNLDTSVCLPRPLEPNFDAYKTIFAILFICLFLNIFEAYALRLRHIVSSTYYPAREKLRAVWLYNHILLSRGGFFLFTRRQLHRKWKNEKDIEKMSLISRLETKYAFFRKLVRLFGRKRKHCLSCGHEGKESDMTNFTHCANCNMPYCNDCFTALGNVCTACMNPVDYGDQDDVSVETDSSEEEEDKLIRVATLKMRKQKAAKKVDERRPSRLLSLFQKKFLNPDDPMTNKPSSDEGEYTSEYDESYQYESNATTSEDDRPKAQLKKARADKVSMDIFKERMDHNVLA